MYRSILRPIAALSAVLAACLIVGWVRAHFTADRLIWNQYLDDGTRRIEISSGDGILAFVYFRFQCTSANPTADWDIACFYGRYQGNWYDDSPGWGWHWKRIDPNDDISFHLEPDATFLERRGFTALIGSSDESREPRGNDIDDREIPTRDSAAGFAAPYWFWLLLTLLLPAVHCLRFVRTRRRQRRGLCITCGYDLRASSDRCPECGTPIPSAASASPCSPPSPRSP